MCGLRSITTFSRFQRFGGRPFPFVFLCECFKLRSRRFYSHQCHAMFSSWIFPEFNGWWARGFGEVKYTQKCRMEKPRSFMPSEEAALAARVCLRKPMPTKTSRTMCVTVFHRSYPTEQMCWVHQQYFLKIVSCSASKLLPLFSACTCVVAPRAVARRWTITHCVMRSKDALRLFVPSIKTALISCNCWWMPVPLKTPRTMCAAWYGNRIDWKNLTDARVLCNMSSQSVRVCIFFQRC